MKWFNKNWFKLVLAALLLFSVSSVTYYFLKIIPAIEYQKITKDKTSECLKQRQVIEDYYTILHSTDKDHVSSSNHYNKKMDICFVEVGFIYYFGDPSTDSEILRDTYSIFNAYDRNLVLESETDNAQGKDAYTISESYVDYSTTTEGTTISKTDFKKLEFFYLNN